MNAITPAKGQIWIARFDTTRVIKIVHCDDEAQVVTRYRDKGRPSHNRRPISFLTLRESWYLEGSRPTPKVDESKLCEMKRGALYRMKYPSDAERGRIIRLMQWNDDTIPGGGVGYEDHGAEMKAQKDLTVYHFRRKWEMVCETLDQLSEYLVKGEPLVAHERVLRGRPPAGHTRQERDEISKLKKKLAERDAEMAAVMQRLQQIEASMASNVVPIRKQKRGSHA